MGKVTASGGQGFDVLFVSSPFAEALQQLGLVAAIDPAQVPNLKNLYPEAQALPHDPGNKFSVPYTWGTTGLCWRSDLVGADPTSWKDLLEPTDALKGKTTMLATDRWLLAAGFLADGDSVNTTDQAEIDAARDRLIAAKRTLLAYDDTTFYSKLVSGEASLVQAWDGWCNYGITDNPAIKYAIPKEGSDLWVDTMVITRSIREQGSRAQVHRLRARPRQRRLGREQHTVQGAFEGGDGRDRPGAAQDLPQSRHGARRPDQARNSCATSARRRRPIRVRSRRSWPPSDRPLAPAGADAAGAALSRPLPARPVLAGAGARRLRARDLWRRRLERLRHGQSRPGARPALPRHPRSTRPGSPPPPRWWPC